MNAPLPARVLLGVGSRLNGPAGDLIVTSISRGWVHAIDDGGRRIDPLPVKAAARMMMTEDDPPPLNPRVHQLRDRLTPKANAKLAKEDRYLHLLRTGLTDKELPPGVDPRELDPQRVGDASLRFNTLAHVYAHWESVKVASAREQLKRIIEREAGGLHRRVHQHFLRHTSPRLDPRYPQIIEKWLEDDATRSNKSVRTIYLDFTVELRDEHPEIDQVLSETTFGRYVAEIRRRNPKLQKRAATRASAMRVPTPSPKKKRASAPGRMWLADSTVATVQLWDPRAPGKHRTLYRPITTFVMTGDSGLIVGRSVTKTGDTYAVSMAFADALASMVDDDNFVEVDGRRTPRSLDEPPNTLALRPVFPESIVTDNGMNYVSDAFVAQAEAMHVDFDPARAGSPTDKAPVESQIGAIRKMFEEHQAGYVGFGVDQRGADVDAETVLTYYDYVERLDQFIALYNYQHVNTGLSHPAYPGETFTPHELAMRIAEEQGVHEVPRWVNQWIRFLPAFQAKITKEGVAWKDWLFSAPILHELIADSALAAGGKWYFYRNPADLRRIYTFDGAGQAYEVPWVHLTEDTPIFGEHSAGVAKETIGKKHHTKREYNTHFRELLYQWRKEDKRRKHLLRTDRQTLEEEMQQDALRRIQRVDQGQIIRAPYPTASDAAPAIEPVPEAKPMPERQAPKQIESTPKSGPGPTAGDDADLYAEFE